MERSLLLALLFASTASLLVDAFVPNPNAGSLTSLPNRSSRSSRGAARFRQHASRQASSVLRMAEAQDSDGDNKDRKDMPTWMFTKEGRAYAPWMVDQFSPENVKKVEESMERRRMAEAARVKNAQGSLALDPQQMELSGLGLRTKVVGDGIELKWKTGDETDNLGFVISRRKGKSDDWIELASYKDFPPLNSKGEKGGSYSFLDPEVEEGTWVYRVSDINKEGGKSDLCQCLVEKQSEQDQLTAKISVAFISVAVLAALAAGYFLDPMNT